MDIDVVIEKAFEDHEAAIRRRALRLTRDADVAADITQEAFLRLFVEAQAGRLPENIEAWLYRTSANLVISRGRRAEVARRYAPRLLCDDRPSQPDEVVLRQEECEVLMAAVATLPGRDGLAVVMAAQGATGQQIASKLELSHVATRALLYRARMRLRPRLAETRTRDAA